MSDLFTTLQRGNEERTFTDDALRSMNKKYLSYIASKNGNAMQKPEGWDEFIGNRVITKGDKMAALIITNQVESRQTSHIRPVAFMNTRGGHFHFEPTTITYVSLSGTETVKANAPVPTPVGKRENYSNCQQLTLLAAQLVGVKEGKWTPTMNLASWASVLYKDGMSREVHMMSWAMDIATLLNKDSSWEVMDLPTKNSQAGPEKISFIRNVLDSQEPHMYDMLNTTFVMTVLCPLVNVGGDWQYRNDHQGKRAIDETCYVEVTDISRRSEAWLNSKGWPAVFWYVGGYVPLLTLPQSTGRLKEAVERHQRMVDVQQGNDSATAIIAGMRGFSGLTDNMGKRICFYLSAMLGAWWQGKDVDIQLESIGDLPMLKSSANKWQLYLLDNKVMEKVPSVKYIVPAVSDAQNVSTILQSEIIYTPRANTVIIYYYDRTLPTSTEKKTPVDYRAAARKIIPQPWRANGIIAYMPIYDECYFNVRQYDDSKVYANEVPPLPPLFMSPIYVHPFGTASDFRGIVTTLKDLRMIGFGRSKKEGRWDMDRPNTLVDTNLPAVPDFATWLNLCSRDMGLQIIAWLNPVSRYSPISNLPHISRGGVTIVHEQLNREEGYMLQNDRVIQSSQMGSGVVFKTRRQTVLPQEKEIPSQTKIVSIGEINTGNSSMTNNVNSVVSTTSTNTQPTIITSTTTSFQSKKTNQPTVPMPQDEVNYEEEALGPPPEKFDVSNI